MRKSWRMGLCIVLFCAWPQLGCHQLPGDKSVKDLTPVQPKPGADKKQELTAAEVTQNWLANADKLEKAGRSDEAIALCEKMRQPGSPQAAQATKKIAILYDRVHDLDKAEQEYRGMLLKNPKDFKALHGLGWLGYQRGHWGTAEQYLSKALAVNPNHTYARVDLGMTLAQQERYSESVEEFTKVLPKAEAYCKVAFVMKLQGKMRDAATAYEQALRIDPTMREATTGLASLRTLVQVDPPAPQNPTTRRGTVDSMDIPLPVLNEAPGRQMNVRPALPPLPIAD